MERTRRRRLKVWATEYGQPTSEGSEQEQADFTEDFMNSWQTVEGTGPIFLYTTRDIDSASTAPDETLGLFFDNGRPKLAAFVVAAFLDANPPGPLPDDRSLLARLAAAARELVRITGEVIQFGVQATVGVIQYLVTSTVAWIRGVANFAVDVVQAGVQLVRDIVDRITNGPSPPAMAVATLSDGSAPAALRATQPSANGFDPAAQRFSAKAGAVDVGDTPEAGIVSAVETGDVPVGVVTAGGQGDAIGVDQHEAAEPTTAAHDAAKPTTAVKPSEDPDPSKRHTATLSKTAIKPSQANKKDEPESTSQAKPAAAGGVGSATDGADEGGSED